MNINSAFPSKYIKESDLNGTQPVVTIDRVAMENVGQGAKQEMKPVVYFKGKQKGLVCNKTNGTMIARIAGSPDTDHWAGVQIRLISTEVEYQGEPVNAIRVREVPKNGAGRAPTRPTPPPAPEHVETPDEDSIPF